MKIAYFVSCTRGYKLRCQHPDDHSNFNALLGHSISLRAFFFLPFFILSFHLEIICFFFCFIFIWSSMKWLFHNISLFLLIFCFFPLLSSIFAISFCPSYYIIFSALIFFFSYSEVDREKFSFFFLML